MSAAPSPTCSCFDAATGTLPHRQGAVAPRRRGARLPQRPATRSAAPPAIDSIVHGTTVGTNTLLERRGPKIGVITTRGFRDVLEMRRRDRRRTWGLWGDFMPIADRDMRLEVDERTLADGTIRDRGRSGRRSAPPRSSCCDKGARGRRDHLHQRLRQCRERAPRARRLCARSGRTSTSPPRTRCCPKSASSSAPRPRRSTPICSRWSPPISASSKPRLPTQKFPGQLHIVQSNGGIMSTATARRLPVRTALSGPAAGVVAGAALAKAAGFDNLITCDLGGTSFDVSLIAGGKVVGRGADHDRFRPRHPHADDRDHHHRRGRRLDRLGRSRRPAAGRAGKRRLGAGAGLLRPGQHPADADRRAGRARPHQRGAPARRRAEVARCRGGASAPSPRMSASRSGSTPTTRRPRSCASPMRAWPARSGWCRSSAATIRRSSSRCRSAAAARCMSAR